MTSASNNNLPQADIGIFGGSGFYEFLENPQQVQIDTPYGHTSGNIMLGSLSGKRVAFLPRHGKDHTIPPHLVNYRANVWAFKQLGCHSVISPCAVGSLRQDVKPGSFVILDQYVDRTNSRQDTFFEGPNIVHTSAADPYCEELRNAAINAAEATGIEYHERGTVVVIQGPRFSTRSESNWFRSMNWEVINMSQYPEVHLVKELDMRACGIALVTDYDTGIPGVEAVTHEEVLKVMAANTGKLKALLLEMIQNIPDFHKTNASAQKQAVGV